MLGNLAWCGKMRVASLCMWILVFWNTVIICPVDIVSFCCVFITRYSLLGGL